MSKSTKAAAAALGSLLGSIILFFVIYGGNWWVWHTYGREFFPNLSPALLDIEFWTFALIVIAVRCMVRIIFRHK